MKTINLIIAIHNHQPVGNFDDVFIAVYEEAYKPFLDILDRYPEVSVVMHYSGCLLEWLEVNRPEIFSRLRSMIESGRLEIMGGGFYEPIMTMLPERDRIGQIKLFTEYLSEHLGASVRGLWLPERVWEQSLTKSIALAGIEYIVVDDTHFKAAGLDEHQLYGFYTTEDQGMVIKAFPGNERLRYLIPFEKPEETIGYLRSIATEDGERIAIYADDGEKFGGWPGTHKYIYDEGWLDNFLDLLTHNSDWIRTTTFSKTIDKLPPVGKIYLPDASYREMTEWALPADRLVQYQDLIHKLDNISELPGDEVKQFIKAGFWRNFKAKYPESNLMYAKMMEVSEKVNSLNQDSPSYATALRSLYKGQCNCPYWHGVFGGLYFPHLRRITYNNLLAAENEADFGSGDNKASLRVKDFDFDGRKEVCISTPHINAYFKPDRGGHLYEFDIRKRNFNALATLAQHKEAYHRPLWNSASGGGEISYDWYLRESLIDHFFLYTQLDNEVWTSGVYPPRSMERGDFVDGEYSKVREESDKSCTTITMSRDGNVKVQSEIGAEVPLQHYVRIVKKAIVEYDVSGISLDYTIENLDSRVLNTLFGIEFNFAMSSGREPDRYYYRRVSAREQPSALKSLEQEVSSLSTHKESLGDLSSRKLVKSILQIGIIDEWLGVDISLNMSEEALVWLFPIETIFAKVGANVWEEREKAFERVYQSSAILPMWNLNLLPQEQYNLKICMEITLK